MELSDFISQALLEIDSAIKKVRKTSGDPQKIPTEIDTQSDCAKDKNLADLRIWHGGVDADWKSMFFVDFDISVSASESKDANMKGKINVVAAGLNSNIQSQNTNSSTHRIKFTLPLTLS